MRKNLVFMLFISIALLLSGSWYSVYGQKSGTYQKSPITLKVNEKSLKSVLDTLSKMANVHFFYNHSQVNGEKKVTVNAVNTPLEDVVKKLIAGMNIEVSYEPNRTIVFKLAAKKNTGVPVLKVSGKIIDIKTNESLPGASVVMAVNRSVGVVSDIDGKFSIEVPEGTDALLVSFVGYQEERLDLFKHDLAKEILVKMTPATEELGDVVVTGMAPRKVEGFTGGYVTVKGEELKRLNPTNILKALQMFDPSFRIVENNARGSDPNTLPEFRLRGDVQLGELSSSTMNMLLGDYSNRPNMPLFILDGFESTLQKIVDLDPDRVESITILKDASATAIYGSRASNGVVVFETKKPLPGALNISYSSNYTLSAPDLGVYNLMNAEEKLEYERRAGLFEGRAERLNYYNEKLADIKEGVDTYWLSEPVRVGFTHRQNVRAEGGDEAFRYNVSLNFEMENGVMKESDRRNLGGEVGLSYRRKKWNVQNSLSLTSILSHDTPYGSFSEYAKMNPYYKKRNEYGQYSKIIENKFGAVGTDNARIANPLYDTQFASFNKSTNFSLTNNFLIECAIQENLRAQVSFSFTKTQGESDAFVSSNDSSFENINLDERGTYSKSWANSFSWTLTGQISYNWIKDKHFVGLSGNYTMTESSSNSISLAAKGFPNDNMDDIHFAHDISKADNQVDIGEEEMERSLGITASLSYMYDYRYALDATLRGDLSSQFGGDTDMAPFWSFGVRWNVHKEKFIENLGWISNLVLRANLGTTGSQNYEPYQAKETYSFEDLLFMYQSSDVMGAQMMALGNPELGWSTTKSRSVAFEIGVWQDRLSASFQYYNNLTDEMLQDYNIAPSSGFTSIVMNLGSVRNEGYEITLNAVPINDYQRGMQWSVYFNGSHNRNVIENISNELEALNAENLKAGSGAPLPVYQEGESTSQLWVVRSLGIDPMTGEEVFLKRSGERTYEWDPVDKVPVGDENPKLQGSVGSTFSWKDFSVTLGCMYEFGGYTYNSTLVDKIENADIRYNMDKRAFKDRWEKPGDIAKFKRIDTEGAQTQMSSRFVEKKNEFQFSSISVDYRFDAEKYKWLRKLNIASINVGTTFNDLGRISSIKMERGTDYPFARAFNLSLSVLFN